MKIIKTDRADVNFKVPCRIKWETESRIVLNKFLW